MTARIRFLINQRNQTRVIVDGPDPTHKSVKPRIAVQKTNANIDNDTIADIEQRQHQHLVVAGCFIDFAGLRNDRAGQVCNARTPSLPTCTRRLT